MPHQQGRLHSLLLGSTSVGNNLNGCVKVSPELATSVAYGARHVGVGTVPNVDITLGEAVTAGVLGVWFVTSGVGEMRIGVIAVGTGNDTVGLT